MCAKPKGVGETCFAHWRLAVSRSRQNTSLKKYYSVDVVYAILHDNFIFIESQVKFQISNIVMQIGLLCISTGQRNVPFSL